MTIAIATALATHWKTSFILVMNSSHG